MRARLRWLTLAACLSAVTAASQLVRLTDLSSRDIARLDRAKTVVLMPGGVIEEHGLHLPVFTDGFMNEWWTERIGEALVAKGYTALVFPMLPLGDGGANEIGRKYAFPGSLRAVYMDLATELGEQGFRWIFVVQNHGSPIHNLVIDQAGDYFRDTYAGHMVNLTGLEPVDPPPGPRPSEEAEKANGIDIHAGLSETSRILFLKPSLVSPGVAQAAAFPARAPQDFVSIAQKDGWPGYFGAPRYATAAFGVEVLRYRADRYVELALSILGGKDEREIPRYSTEAMKREKDTMDASLAYDETVRKKQDAWMKKNHVE